jgi:hypothetical protein
VYFTLFLLALFQSAAPTTGAPPAHAAVNDYYLVCSYAGHAVGCDAQAQCESCEMACRKADSSLPLAEECSLKIDSVTVASRNGGTPLFAFKPSTPLASVEFMPQNDPRVLFLQLNGRNPRLVSYSAYEVRKSTLVLEPTSLACIDAPSGLISGADGPGIECSFRNEYFETLVPVFYNYEKHAFVLQSESPAGFSVRAMSAAGGDGSPAQSLHRVSPVALKAGSIELCANHEANASCEKVDIAANISVKLLGSWAPLQEDASGKKSPGRLHVKMDLANAWLHIELNGTSGWIHGDKNFRAIGLPIQQPEPAAAPRPPQNQPLD